MYKFSNLRRPESIHYVKYIGCLYETYISPVKKTADKSAKIKSFAIVLERFVVDR
jgi:hypothetical protein